MVPFCLSLLFLMKMSSHGTFNAIQNNEATSKEGLVAPMGVQYSLQSEVCDPKTNSRAKFAKNKSARRRNKMKAMRANGKTEVPKAPPVPRSGKIEVTNDSCDYVHQSLLEHIYPPSILDDARNYLGKLNTNVDVSKLYEVLEVVGALSVSLQVCKTPAQVASQIVLSIRALSNGSIVENVLRKAETIEWCKNVFGYNLFVQQTGATIEEVNWLKALPSLKENWTAVRNSPIFSKIGTLISLAASVGLCSVSRLTWSIKGVELFRMGTINKQSTAIDLVGAVLDTIVTFLEGGYECFRTGSFTPLLFTTDDSRALDALYFPLIELHEHAMVFNLHAKPVEIEGETRTLSDHDYSVYLNKAIDLAERAYNSAKGTWQQTYLERRREVLHKNRAAYNAKRLDGGLRFAPYTVYIWGESGVGKSTLAQIIMADCLSAAGANPDPKNVAIVKETDKYDSSLKGDTVGIYLDDFGNTKADFLEKSPIERLIDYNNNMVTYANKADLHEKGKIAIIPKIMVVTSNAPLFNHANIGSICPFSGVRRADVHIYAHMKPDFATQDKRLDKSKVSDAFPDDDIVNDIWNLDMYVPRESKHGGDARHLIGVGGTTTRVTYSINQALRFLTSDCKKHFGEQERIIRKSENLVASRKYCSACRLAHTLCECEPEVDVDKSEEQVSVQETFEYLNAQMESIGMVTHRICDAIPYYFVRHPLVQTLYLISYHREFRAYERRMRYMYMAVVAAAWAGMMRYTAWYAVYMPCGPVAVALCGYLCALARWRADKLDALMNRTDITGEIFASIRRSKLATFLSMCIVGNIIYNFVNMFRGVNSVCQTALAPENVETIEARDKEENPWAEAVVAELHVSDKAKTMTHDQVVAKVAANLYHGVFVENDFQQACDLLALGGNIYLMPYHLFKNRKDMRALITKRKPTELNSTFKAVVSVAHMIPIEGKDLCVVYMASGGVHSDILHLFPETVTASGLASFLYREQDGNLKNDRVRITYLKNSGSGGAGFKYSLPYNTYTGLCMGVAVSDYAKSCIASLHLRGIPDTPEGIGLTVGKSELEAAISKAHTTWRAAFPSVTNGTFPLSRYENQVLTSRNIHPKSPVNYMPQGSTIEYLGEGGSRVTHTTSKVRVTPISPIVEEVTGVKRQHGAPKFHRTRMWQASLAHSANPSPGIEGSLLEKAYADYTDHLVDKFKSRKFRRWIKKELKPLTKMQTLCGRDGKRFVDAMKRGTSKGFPLSGPKRDMIILLNPEDYPDFQCPAEVDATIIAEMERMEQCLLKGERCYSIFKACVKDEPTKLGKDKVRVFQAADWATQLIIRKYFLPIARILSMFPTDSECAVGVNAQGPEWDELAKFMRRFGLDRILAGDYNKYDLRMAAQLIIAAFAVMIEIAEECGEYTPDDIKIMKGISAEIAYSCVAYNGDIIIHCGSNPSGQNLTVYVNCIVNSLLMRCCYFHLWPLKSKPFPFREVAAMMTYGDDVKGSVREGFDWFNHKSYAKFLKERDMIFTMPDKEAEPTEYMHDDDADFLKRKNVYNVDTGLIHGALDEESIFKSLHTVLESKVQSLEEVSISNIDGALREWWQHGREVYEKRRDQMKKVAAKAGFSDHCTMLRQSYEDRLQHFHERYANGDADADFDEPVLVTTVGDEWDFENPH